MRNLVEQIAPKYGIPIDLMIALGMQESGLDPAAVGDGGWSHGAWQIYLKAHNITQAQAHDPTFSTNYAAQFLARLYKKFGNWPDALSGYNSGRPLAQAPESTKRYVQKILGGQVAGAAATGGAVPGGYGGGVPGGYGGGVSAGVKMPSPPRPQMPKATLRVRSTPVKTARISLPKRSEAFVPEPWKPYQIEAPKGSQAYRLTEPTVPTIRQPKVTIPKGEYPQIRLPGPGSLRS